VSPLLNSFCWSRVMLKTAARFLHLFGSLSHLQKSLGDVLIKQCARLAANPGPRTGTWNVRLSGGKFLETRESGLMNGHSYRRSVPPGHVGRNPSNNSDAFSEKTGRTAAVSSSTRARAASAVAALWAMASLCFNANENASGSVSTRPAAKQLEPMRSMREIMKMVFIHMRFGRWMAEKCRELILYYLIS